MKVEEIIGKVFGIDPKIVSDETSPGNTPEWDSFNGLMLVTELEKNFNVEFGIHEIISVKNVSDIKESLRKHGVKI